MYVEPESMPVARARASTCSILIASQSVLWLVFGVALLIAPDTMLAIFLAVPNASAAALGRIFGAELVGLALASWFTRYPRERTTLLWLQLTYCLCNTLGFCASLHGVRTGALTAAGWVLVAMYLVYAVGFGVLRVLRAG